MQICHPGGDKNRSPAALKALEELSRLPPRRHANLDPFGRRSAAWRVDQTMQEIERMNKHLADMLAAGASRQKLRNGRQHNATDRTLDPKGALPEMMEDVRASVQSMCEERQDEMIQHMEEERASIRQQADQEAQAKKEMLSEQRKKTEAVTAEMATLRGRLAAAIEPLPTPDDEDERRRIYIRKLKKAEAKTAAVRKMVGKGDGQDLYDRSRKLYLEQGANVSAPSVTQWVNYCAARLVCRSLAVCCGIWSLFLKRFDCLWLPCSRSTTSRKRKER